MKRWIDATLLERKFMLQQTAAKESLPEYAVEKDWRQNSMYVCKLSVLLSLR